MIPVGYMYKKVAAKPAWLKTDGVADIYSLSSCVSENFADYIKYWKHNGYWLFDSPAIIEALAQGKDIDLSGMRLFYYEVFEKEFNEESKQWSLFRPEALFTTKVLIPAQKQLEGFDVTTFMCRTSPECSPLSCNDCASAIPVNSHCLFPEFKDATQALEDGVFNKSEPGPFRIFAVYSVDNGMTFQPGGRR